MTNKEHRGRMRVITKIFVVLLVLVLTFVNISFSSATDTELQINNSAPQLIQNIPNITIYHGDNATNILDLDDYFRDDNGDSFIMNYSSITNATLSIDAQNRLSITYDAGFQGTQSLQITVTDIGGASATSNTFYLIIGPDNEAPKWFSASINRAAVYQNYFVEFSALWTDNDALSGSVLSVNQGSGWTNSSAISLTGTSNVSKDSLQISASPGTVVFWRIYAFDEAGNYNVTDIFNFTVQEFEVTEEDFESFVGSSTTSASSGSGSTTSTTTSQGGIARENFQVDTSSIRVSLRQGDTTTRVLRITNLDDAPLNFKADLQKIDALGVLSHTEFTIPAGETFELTLDLIIKRDQMPDEYFGTIVIGAGDSVVIPVVVDVKPFDSIIAVAVNVTGDSRYVNQGEQVTALISIRSLLDTRQGQAELFYALKDFSGNILDSKNESFSFFQSFEEERSLTVPEGTRDGEYIFYAIAFFDNRVDLDSDTFIVGFKFRLILLLKNFLYLLIFVLLILVILYLYWLYRRNKRKKELLELYLLLNELRSLVKKGKTQNALGVYKRIKVAYGQKMSKEYLKDQTKMKEELEKFAKLLKTTPITATPAAQPAAKLGAKPAVAGSKPPATPTNASAKPAATAKPSNPQKVSSTEKKAFSSTAKKPTTPAKPVASKPPVVSKKTVPPAKVAPTKAPVVKSSPKIPSQEKLSSPSPVGEKKVLPSKAPVKQAKPVVAEKKAPAPQPKEAKPKPVVESKKEGSGDEKK